MILIADPFITDSMRTSLLLFAGCLIFSTSSAQVATEEIQVNASLVDHSLVITPTEPTDPASAYTSGIDPASIRSEEGLVIWPIPARSELTIFCSSETSGNLPFEIVDMTGRTIVRGSIQGEKPNLIEVSNLQKGDHLLRVVDGSGVRSIAFQSQGE